MNKNEKTLSKLMAMLLAIIMTLGAAPLNVLAEVLPFGAEDVLIIGFEPLADEIVHQTVPFGTELSELNFIPYVPTDEDEENGYANGGELAIIAKPEDEEDGITEGQ